MSAKYPVGGEFTIDGVSSDTWNCFYTALHIGLMPSLRLNTPDIPGRAGKSNAGIEWSSKALTADVTFSSRLTLLKDMQALAAALDPTVVGAHKMVFKDDNPSQYIWVIPAADMPVTTEPGAANFTLALQALDPYWYANVAQHLALGTVASGTANIALPNGGTAPANPVITITRPAGAVNPLTGIAITINGITVNYAGTVAAADTLVIDIGAMSITKNGVLDLANWTGDFPQIPAGGSTMSYADTNRVGAVITVDYPERWT